MEMEENDQRQNEDKDDWLHIEEPQEKWKLELAAALKFKRQKKMRMSLDRDIVLTQKTVALK